MSRRIAIKARNYAGRSAWPVGPTQIALVNFIGGAGRDKLGFTDADGYWGVSLTYICESSLGNISRNALRESLNALVRRELIERNTRGNIVVYRLSDEGQKFLRRMQG